MICVSCEEYVNYEVNKFNGIISLKVFYENGNVIIEFDKIKINEMDIEKVINLIGYKVIDKKEN